MNDLDPLHTLPDEERQRRAHLAERIRRVGNGHRRAIALYRRRDDSEPALIGIVAAIETDGVRMRGTAKDGTGSFAPWSGIERVGIGDAFDPAPMLSERELGELEVDERKRQLLDVVLDAKDVVELAEILYAAENAAQGKAPTQTTLISKAQRRAFNALADFARAEGKVRATYW